MVVVTCGSEKRILVIKQPRFPVGDIGSYGFPAGVIDDGENPIQAAVREVREETGIVLSENSLIDLNSFSGNQVGSRTSGGILSECMYSFAAELEVNETDYSE